MASEGGEPGDDGAAGPSHAGFHASNDQTEPTGVVASRSGQVLLAHTLLKSDHFPGCQNLKLKPLIDGAPNFRKIDGLPVYGVAIPTVLGLRNILGQLGVTAKNQRRLVWINLREEPLLYVNGSPYVVRESDKPFANLEYSGIDAARVVEMEDRLKQDVLNEAALYDGSILVAHEDDQFQVVEDWEPVTEVDVQTPLEVYEELTRDGFNVDYLRVPITDEKAPMGDDFEILMRTAWELGESDSIIFNCQMGRGRTTTGMVIACCILLRKAQGHLAPPPVLPESSLPQWWCSQEDFSDIASPKSGGTADDLKNGMFLSIRSVMRALENGKSAKMALDLILDACAAMQNLREAIATYRKRVFLEPNEIRRQSLLQVCLEYLDRYYSLIVFAAYLDDPGFAFGSNNHVPFSRWVKDRPELLGILERLLRSNPLSALAFDRMERREHGDWDQGGSALALATRASLEGQLVGREETFAEHIATRPGSVLGPHTILKLDHFKGCQSSRLVNEIDGAPNFRGLSGPGLHVYGGAIATVDGIKRVLHSVGAGPDDEQQRSAVWHMMREEPVVYINGDPYVLREASRPFKNLMEYRGIDAFRLDQMEQRLQDDVIQEAAQMDGQIIVTVEEKDASGGTSVTDKIIKVTDQSVVETPRQVLEKFQSEGYRVTFIRIPLTDGTCPKPRDFDCFFGAAAASRPNDALIYTCQLGGGRTTTGMCIGTLLRMHLNGAAMPKTSTVDREASLLRLDEDLGSVSPRYTTEDLEVDGELVLEDPNRETPRTASKMRVANAPEIDRERVNMENGEYLGVRRFTRTLERGGEVKAEVDAVIDACGVIVNLRTAIMRYRKPKSTEFFRPELGSRHSAFQRGSTYMERYCMLMAFSVYLNECRQKGRALTFEDWLSTRTDITTAVDGIHQNPAGALAPVPLVPSISALFNPGEDLECLSLSSSAMSFDTDKDVSIIEARGVLMRRRGNTIGKRTILKSYTIAGEHHGRNVSPHLLVDGISDIQAVDGLPIYTIGNASISGLRQFMHKAGALPGGNTHIIFTDLREELVIYINGTAYMRREVEMAAAALHHAGIKAVKLEDLERRLRTDVMNEAIAWGGKILLHRELDADKPGEQALRPSRLSFETERTFSLRKFGSRLFGASSSDGSLHGEHVEAHSTTPDTHPNSRIAHMAAGSHEDITKTTSYQTSTFVSAFWERTGDGLDGDIDAGIWTPAEVFLGLAAEGYSLEYKRVPMSRERTPRADDLDQIYLQMNPEVPRRTDGKVLHVFISRTANGSSARFAATFACGCLLGRPDIPDPSGLAIATENSGHGPAPPSGDSTHSAHSFQAHHMHRVDSGVDMFRSIESGEYRGIMSLLRALPRGTDAKEAIDDAIDRCSSIGSITRDILQCKVISEDEAGFDGPAGLHLGDALFAKRLGLHYLLRYFYLIAFRAYLYDMERKSLHGNGVSFRQWVDGRKEISYLASSLRLE